MPLKQVDWVCPCCGAVLIVIADRREPQVNRGGRPRGSRNRPKAETPAAELLPRKRKGEEAPKPGFEPDNRQGGMGPTVAGVKRDG